MFESMITSISNFGELSLYYEMEEIGYDQVDIVFEKPNIDNSFNLKDILRSIALPTLPSKREIQNLRDKEERQKNQELSQSKPNLF